MSTACTVTVFGQHLATFDLDTRNHWRALTEQDCDCEECTAYQEAVTLDSLWRTQRNRMYVFDTVGPVEDYS